MWLNFLRSLFGSIQLPVKTITSPAAAPVKIAVKPAVTTQALPVGPEAYADGILDVSEVYLIAKWLKAKHSELAQADPYMAAVMATTESGGNSRKIPTFLERFEPGFLRKYLLPKGITDQRRATSYGIMQVMLNTALEDYNRGFKTYGVPTDASLKNPYTSIYFGMAHQIYIRRGLTARAIPLTERNIVMSYNGGLGANNTDTQKHYAKYASNKAVVNNAIA